MEPEKLMNPITLAQMNLASLDWTTIVANYIAEKP
jgi:hypothetical protein